MSRHNSDIASIWHSDIHTDFWDTDILIAKKREELRQISGKKSEMIQAILGFSDGPEVVHRNDMVLS